MSKKGTAHYPPLPEIVPVFPLPTVVFFPGTILPLHIFEDRYKQMIQDARQGSGIIAMALMKTGWEPEYYGTPEVHRLGCAGVLAEVVQLPGGRFNIKLAGVSRVLFRSFHAGKPYQQAQIQALPETVPDDAADAVQQSRNQLIQSYADLVNAATGKPAEGLKAAAETSFHTLVNTICAHIDLQVVAKQELLRIDSVLDRCNAMTRLLQQEAERQRLLRAEGGDDTPSTVH